MNAMVIYESIYGNTRAIAEAIAEGLGDAPVMTTGQLPAGGPGPTSSSSADRPTSTAWPPHAAGAPPSRGRRQPPRPQRGRTGAARLAR